MPPAQTGVADYAEGLFRELRKTGDVRLNDGSAEVALYHIGNNHLHREIYKRAIEHPGVVVVHDAVLQHFFLGSLDEREYTDEFISITESGCAAWRASCGAIERARRRIRATSRIRC